MDLERMLAEHDHILNTLETQGESLSFEERNALWCELRVLQMKLGKHFEERLAQNPQQSISI